MKNFKLLTILILLFSLTIKGQNNEDLFFSFFPKEKTPFLTKGIGYSNFYYKNNGYKLLPDSISLKYICLGDTGCLTFSYIRRHLENENYKKKITKKYQFYAVAFFEKEHFNIVLFPFRNPYRKELHARSYTKNGEFIDSLILNDYRSEQYYDNLSFKYSLIKEKNIFVLNYVDLYKPNMRKDNNYKELNKTEVIVNKYKIKKNGYFNRVNQDTILLKSNISIYEPDKRRIDEGNPLNNYYTQ